MPPAAAYFPLRWESTGDQWWYATPIDCAAANGQYDVVRELLHLDPNLLIKLTSLRRIRRLETVWDDDGDARFAGVARGRASVARRLLLDCQTTGKDKYHQPRLRRRDRNSLIRAGHGGWLLYTAASAGDLDFVKELLGIDPMLVFGEGEYGVTDMLYAAARSKRSEVFRMFLEVSAGGGGGIGTRWDVIDSEFKWEMMNRAVHAAARGGDLGTLKELLRDCSDVSVFRDAQGSTILHTASGGGQVEVAEDILASYDIISLTDNQGNGALNVAAYRGHLPVVKALILKSPSSALVANHCGDTFLHMAVAGFRTPGFRMLDRQIELMKHLLTSEALHVPDIINFRNNEGRTALHMAVTGNIKSEVVELLINAPLVDLNIRDAEGLTPLDLLKRQPQSTSSEILIKRLACVGGISNCEDPAARRTVVSNLRMQGIAGTSPGTSFRVSDAEIVLHTGIQSDSEPSPDAVSAETSPCSSDELSQVSGRVPSFLGHKKSSSVSYAARRLRALLQWPKKKEKKFDCSSSESYSTCRDRDDHQSALLGHKFSKTPSLPNNMRTHSLRRNYLLGHSTRRNFVAGLMQGVIKVTPQEVVSAQSPSSTAFGHSVSSSPIAGNSIDGGRTTPAMNMQASFDKRLINQYLCFGAQGLAVEHSIKQ